MKHHLTYGGRVNTTWYYMSDGFPSSTVSPSVMEWPGTEEIDETVAGIRSEGLKAAHYQASFDFNKNILLFQILVIPVGIRLSRHPIPLQRTAEDEFGREESACLGQHHSLG